MKKLLKGCRNLRTFSIRVFVDPEYLDRIGVCSLPYIQSALKITGKSLVRLGKYCKDLRSLSIDERRAVTTQCIDALTLGCNKLVHLSLEGCYEVYYTLSFFLSVFLSFLSFFLSFLPSSFLRRLLFLSTSLSLPSFILPPFLMT